MKTTKGKRLADVLFGIDKLKMTAQQLLAEYAQITACELPAWTSATIQNEDEIPEMDDEAFAECRIGLAREKDLVKRMNAQLMLAVVVARIMDEKRDRIRKLTERVKSGDVSPEVDVARARIRHIEKLVEAIDKRFAAVVRDFAVTRKAILRSCTAASEKMRVTIGENVNAAISLDGSKVSIGRNLELLAQIEASIKRVADKPSTMSFGGRARK